MLVVNSGLSRASDQRTSLSGDETDPSGAHYRIRAEELLQLPP